MCMENRCRAGLGTKDNVYYIYMCCFEYWHPRLLCTRQLKWPSPLSSTKQSEPTLRRVSETTLNETELVNVLRCLALRLLAEDAGERREEVLGGGG